MKIGMSRQLPRPFCVVLICFSCPVLAIAQDARNENRQPTSVVDQLLGNSFLEKSADLRSREIVEEIAAPEPTERKTVPIQPGQQKRMLEVWEVAVDVPGSEVQQQQMKVKAALRLKAAEYLELYKRSRNLAEIEREGIDLVRADHLDLTLLDVKLNRGPTGRKRLNITFDRRFHQHVRKRGRQLKLKKSGRFPLTIYVAAGVFASLLFAYGGLKVMNARAEKTDDYISAGKISMV